MFDVYRESPDMLDHPLNWITVLKYNLATLAFRGTVCRIILALNSSLYQENSDQRGEQ